MTVYQAKFTPESEAAINIMIFEYQGNFETIPKFRQTENHQLNGNHLVFLGRESQIITTRIIVEMATESSIISAVKKRGTLNRAGDSHSGVKLMEAKRIRKLSVTSAINSGVLENTGLYVEMEITLMKEAS
jgi:hypothetical protein